MQIQVLLSEEIKYKAPISAIDVMIEIIFPSNSCLPLTSSGILTASVL